MIRTIDCKLGNMRKVTNWVLYPQKADALNEVIIQCDKRIALVNLDTGKAILSNGKGGHNGFMHLNAVMGAVTVDVPANILAKLVELTGRNTKDDGIGTVRVIGGL